MPRHSPPPSPSSDMPFELSHGLNLRAFSLLFGILLPALVVGRHLTEEVPLWLLLVVLFLLPAGVWALAESRFRILVSDDGVEAQSWLGERRAVAWHQIDRLRYRPLVRSLVLEAWDEDGRSSVEIEVSLMRTHVALLARELLARTDREVWEAAWIRMFGAPPADPGDG